MVELLSWVADVARAHGMPAALYWIQTADDVDKQAVAMDGGGKAAAMNDVCLQPGWEQTGVGGNSTTSCCKVTIYHCQTNMISNQLGSA